MKYVRPFQQQGQAIVLTLVFAAALVLIAFFVYNTSLLANNKTKLQDTADAVAYSAAVLQARDHNFSAYTNRAMVANQVAVAQVVGLKSFFEDAKNQIDRSEGWWLKFWRWMAGDMTNLTWDIPLALAKPLVNVANNEINSSARGLATGLDVLIVGLEKAQNLHHDFTGVDMLLAMSKVTSENDPDIQVSKGTFQIGNMPIRIKKWRDYTASRHANDNSEDRFANVTVDSLDRFSVNRTSPRFVPSLLALGAGNMGVKLCVGATFSAIGFTSVHGGGTQLSRNKKKWRALDATEGSGAWVCVYGCGFPPCGATVGSPILELGGSGGAMVGSGSGYGGEVNGFTRSGFNNGYGWALFNPLVAVPAWYRFGVTGTGGSLDNSARGGLQDTYRDLADVSKLPKDRSAEANSAPYITVELEKGATKNRTSDVVMPGSNALKLAPDLKGGKMKTLSSAQTYFMRPNNNSSMTGTGWKRLIDNKTEYANLFNPYWQARLSKTPDAEKAASALAQ